MGVPSSRNSSTAVSTTEDTCAIPTGMDIDGSAALGIGADGRAANAGEPMRRLEQQGMHKGLR